MVQKLSVRVYLLSLLCAMSTEEAAAVPHDDLIDSDDTPAPHPEERSHIFETRVATAHARREAANDLFRSGDVGGAIRLYELALWHVEFDELSYEYELMDKHRDMVKAARLPVYLNLAACRLKEDGGGGRGRRGSRGDGGYGAACGGGERGCRAGRGADNRAPTELAVAHRGRLSGGAGRVALRTMGRRWRGCRRVVTNMCTRQQTTNTPVSIRILCERPANSKIKIRSDFTHTLDTWTLCVDILSF